MTGIEPAIIIGDNEIVRIRFRLTKLEYDRNMNGTRRLYVESGRGKVPDIIGGAVLIQKSRTLGVISYAIRQLIVPENMTALADKIHHRGKRIMAKQRAQKIVFSIDEIKESYCDE